MFWVMGLNDFASERLPLRCSRLPEFMTCPWKTIMAFLQVHQRDGGSAADTGSATHKAIHKWHSGKGVKEALKAMKEAQAEYPLADFLEAERLFRAYTEDEKNQTAQVVASETLLQGEIEEGIFLEGTADQIREENKTWSIWDVKTSRFSGPQIRDQHTYQLAAYAMLASKRYKRPVHMGGIIMVRGYGAKGGDKVFYPYDLTLDHALLLMRAVADRVRDVRAGRIAAVPGELCNYCIGVKACLEKLGGVSCSLK